MSLAKDKQLIKDRFGAGFGRYDRLARVQQDISATLTRVLGQLRSGSRDEVRRAMEIGIGTGFLTSRLLPVFPLAEWWLNDIAPQAEKYVAKYAAGYDTRYVWGDAENVEFPVQLDLIATASTVQWFDDLSGFTVKAARSLNNGGLLALTTFGEHNFAEIRAAASEGLDYVPLRELELLLAQNGFEVIYSHQYEQVLEFDTPMDVLHHIKGTGVNSIRKTRWNRGQLASFAQTYTDMFSTPQGRVTLTYHPLILVARKL